MSPVASLRAVPATALFSVAHCDFGTVSVLARRRPAENSNLLAAERLVSPSLVSGQVIYRVPAFSQNGKTGRLLWLDTEQEPSTRQLLEAAGFYRAVEENYPQLAVKAQLETEDLESQYSLTDALVLWDSMTRYWDSLPQEVPVWFSRDELSRCGHCAYCRAQMQEVQDLGLLEHVSFRQRKAIFEDLGVRTIAELARLPHEQVTATWAEAVGEAALHEGIDRPEVALLDSAKLHWDEEKSARDIALLAAQRTQELLAEEEVPYEEDPASDAEIRLLNYVDSLPEGELSATDQAIAMIASATGYHRRERTEFWTAHFNRVYQHMSKWELARGVGLVKNQLAVEDWTADPERPRAQPTRIFELELQVGESFSLKKGDKGLCLYYGEVYPSHLAKERGNLALRFEDRNGRLPSVINVPAFRGEILEVENTKDGVFIKVRESLPKNADQFAELPLAIGPATPIPTKAQEAALAQLAQETGQSLPDLPRTAAADIAARRPPRLLSGKLADPADFSGVSPLAEALVDTLERLDSSYLAVQGPPGAGKTFVGSQVLGALLTRGWKIGVVAQSHAVVENMLAACIAKGGVSPERVAKFTGKTKSKTPTWGEITETELSAALAANEGLLIGGTAWDFASEKKFPSASLDLLVIDEAGQYSLANTFAVARSARNLLLLGDPQQLPQVTQGEHPHHVEKSALGWLIGSSPVLPAEFGFFMDQTWRMHPALCAAVSKLSYEGVLTSASAASSRSLAGWEPGVYVERVVHEFNSTASSEEAACVAQIAQRFIGSAWTQDAETRPLMSQDILVVAAYNAQVDAISSALEEADLHGVKVGTVDKFQGQEAPVVIVSMAASIPASSEQVADFLLSPNRLNVAISRGQWAAVLLCSPQFTRYVPRSLSELKILSSFVTLLEEAQYLSIDKQ